MLLNVILDLDQNPQAVKNCRAFDESPHWLYSKKRFEEAQQVLDKIARWNNCQDANTKLVFDREDNLKIENSEDDSSGADTKFNEADDGSKEPNACLQIIKHPRFVAVFVICSFGW